MFLRLGVRAGPAGSLTINSDVSCIQSGADPFVKYQGKLIGETNADPEASAFLDALRVAIVAGHVSNT